MTVKADDYLQGLLVTAPLREATLRAAIQAVQPPSGSRGLDVGCGIGTHTLLLAESVGSSGHVTGFDLSSAFLRQAKLLAREAGLSRQVSFQQGSATRLPFDDGTCDWTWSVDFVGNGTSNSVALIREMARVVRPGGIVAILAWSSERLLPGYPLLEARLSATAAGLAPFSAGMSEDLHLSRGIGWFREVGLREIQAKAVAGSVHAPLTNALRTAMSALISMRWPGVESDLEPEDQSVFHRLCDPESPDFILDHPDYFAFFTYSLFWGTVSE